MARSQLINLIGLLGLFLSVALLLVPSTSAASTTVRYCDKKAQYAVKVSGVDITPYPITRNKKTTFKIAASTDATISGGELVIDVSYFGFNVRTEKHNLCNETSCPVTAGDFEIAHSQVLPGYTPPGSYTLKLKLSDANKQLLTCINFDFSIGFVATEDVADT
ncbi:unnamed protein product [Coffea canephora]|uniref:MD-2-related lipid-recognition domain-containing protein n=2 Tax=Coffea TaxID=13442 RepID=A0A068UQP0_COFCA|nr:unnamed protein product [Coffea canephora]